MLARGRRSIGSRYAGVPVLIAMLFCPPAFAGTTYEVGAGKAFPTISGIPWESLAPGDIVLIYWQAQPYREKWVITAQGTEASPVVISGVPGPNGELPVIDGENAVTRLELDFWSEGRGIIKVGGSSIPDDVTPTYIIIENLDIRGAREPSTFVDDAGDTQSYPENAAAIYVEKGENITIRNCNVHDCGNGLFVASSDAEVSRDILISGNYIYDNGNVGSAFEHNTYTAALNITYEYNRFGPPKAGSVGNGLKDRSAGLVVRYNWLEGGNRQLDLVDAEDSVILRSDPAYSSTFVYGNVMIEAQGTDNSQILHYGGDSGNTPWYRKGTLYLYNNTVVSTRTGNTTWMRLSTNSETCDARNNIAYVTAAGSKLAMLDSTGVLNLSHNWFKTGWVLTHGGLQGTVNDDGSSVEGSSPDFVDEANQDYHLSVASDAVDAGTELNGDVPPEHNVTAQYVVHQSGEPRWVEGLQIDIGAFEWRLAGPCDGDTNSDGLVDPLDAGYIQARFNCDIELDPECEQADVNGDYLVDPLDVGYVLARFGEC